MNRPVDVEQLFGFSETRRQLVLWRVFRWVACPATCIRDELAFHIVNGDDDPPFHAAVVAAAEAEFRNGRSAQPNKLGVSRLDAYFDPNERRYFITLQSVELAIKEEQAKTARGADPAESDGTIPNAAERRPADRSPVSEDAREEIKELKREVMNLTITDRVKEQVIKHYEKDRSQFAQERKEYIEKLMTFNRRIGELETQVLQLAAPSTPVEAAVL